MTKYGPLKFLNKMSSEEAENLKSKFSHLNKLPHEIFIHLSRHFTFHSETILAAL